MSKALFIGSRYLVVYLLFIAMLPCAATADEPPIVITAKTLIADNKNNVVIFEGTVVAKSKDMTIYSDRMEVFYANSMGEITKILAQGNVKTIKDNRVIFSKEATYLRQEEKVIFTGEPRAVDGENVVMGTEIVYYIKEDRSVVKDSRIVIKKRGQ